MRIQFYVLGRTLAGVGVALAAVASVILLVDLVELSRTIGGHPDTSFLIIGQLTLLKSPSIILLLLPFVFLFGSMGAFVSLNRGSELIAMRAAGVSAWDFVIPAVGAAFVIGVLAVTVLNPAAAALNAVYEQAHAKYTGVAADNNEVWLRQSLGESQMVLHARGRDRQGPFIRLKGVSIFIQGGDPSGGMGFTRRIEAGEALLAPGYWMLSNVSEARPGSETLKSETLRLPTSLDEGSAVQKRPAPGAVGFWDLPAAAREASANGYPAAGYRLHLQQLLAMPLLLAAMTLLAATFSLRLFRLGDLALLAGCGVALGFGFFFFNQLCGALGQTDVIPVELAAWCPPTLVLLSALTLLFYTEDG